MRPENSLMRQKIKRRLVEKVVPILSRVVEEGVEQGLFACGNIPERVRMMLILSNEVFDEGGFTEKDVDVFIDVTEKLLGAQAQTLAFIRNLIPAFAPAETTETEEKR